jgi:squalene synthase HpnD
VSTDIETVEAIVRAAGTSFHRGMAILPPPRRQAMYAIYAFCRIVDDIADEDSPFESRRPRLEEWRAHVAALYRGEAHDAVTRELLRAIQAYALKREDFDAVIDGMAMDAASPVVAPDEATLDLYCDRVAAAVGRLSVRAFGDASPAADHVAHHLGRALQLTNILRDIHEDAQRDRLYLPRELLDVHGIPPDPRAALVHPALPQVCTALAARAHQHFESASAAMTQCDRRAMKPARLMGATYAAILSRLAARGWKALDQKVKLSKWAKLRIALLHLLG